MFRREDSPYVCYSAGRESDPEWPLRIQVGLSWPNIQKENNFIPLICCPTNPPICEFTSNTGVIYMFSTCAQSYMTKCHVVPNIWLNFNCSYIYNSIEFFLQIWIVTASFNRVINDFQLYKTWKLNNRDCLSSNLTPWVTSPLYLVPSQDLWRVVLAQIPCRIWASQIKPHVFITASLRFRNQKEDK